MALLALAVISGGSLAAGDLFDDDYKDCPHKTRLRDGQIDDLSVNRDADDADKVNVAWTATDPATWGLGPNAYRTSLVVILDDKDGDPVSKALSLGSRKVVFDKIKTGTPVTVQLAIVVDTAAGNYLISDILETSINQSLTEPAFSTGWREITGATLPKRTGKEADFKIHSRAVAGRLYYIGYNENFGNYKSDDPDLVTTPSTSRLRIGLAHGKEMDNERDDVDFNAYIIRIVDEDGDVVSAGDDVATVTSRDKYKSLRDSDYLDHDGDSATPNFKLTSPVALFLYGIDKVPTFETSDEPEKRTITGTTYALSNVRIVDGDDITVALHNSSVKQTYGINPLRPSPVRLPLSMVRVDTFPLSLNGRITPAFRSNSDAGYSLNDPDDHIPGDFNSPPLPLNKVYAELPDEHRDFPIGTFASDETYTISAWAVNEDDEVISPVVKLKVRPKDTAQGSVSNFIDYHRAPLNLADLTTTEFTVIK